jgi:two-component system response regulator FixJ
MMKQTAFPAAAREEQAVVHLLYQKAVDLRICLMLSRMGCKVKPFSTLDGFLKSCPRDGTVLVDIDGDLDNGAEIVEKVLAAHEGSLVVCLCKNGSTDFFRKCFRAGVIDVLDKSFDDQRVIEALSAVRASVSRQHASVASLRQRRLRFGLLTNREREVFRHLLDGLTSREIGSLLALSPRTVEVHRAHVHEKLHVRNTAQMACDYRELLD